MLQRLLVLPLLVAAVAAAQQASDAEPDYSGVKDILQGRRTLLSINDLVIGGTLLKTSDGSKIENKDISELPGFKRNQGDPEMMGRLFDSKSDTLLYAHGSTAYAIDQPLGRTTSLSLGQDFTRGTIASGDFRGDGLQEMVLASRSYMTIVAAVDPTDFSKGLHSGPYTRLEGTATSAVGVAVGDFDGDGHPDVAVMFDSIFSSGRRLNIYQVDPQTLALKLKHSQVFPVNFADPIVGVSLAAGRFGTTLHDQLLLGYYTAYNFLTFMSFDFDGSLTPIQKDTLTSNKGALNELDLVPAKFDPTSPLDQVAEKRNSRSNAVTVGVITMDNQLKIRLPDPVTLPGVGCSTGGLAVGGFARTEQGQLSLKLQLAISTSNCAGSLGVNIYNVDPPTKAGEDFVINSNAVLSRPLPQTGDNGLPIIAGDIQGRSVILGEPTKIVMEDTAQPSVIAAMPPMHVDFIRPAGGKDPVLLNLSVIPDGFQTLYETSGTNTTQSSTTNTTSWSFGAEISAGASVEIGSVSGGLGIEVGATARAAQDTKAFSEKEYGSYRSNSFNAKVATGFFDQVWYTSSRFNIYVYPVLGRSACRTGKSCAPDAHVPLTIQFSGPDKIESHRIDGNLIPWYQPPWEPGELFSYPATYEQLQKEVPNIQLLSNTPTFSTDTSDATESVTWSKETSEGATASVDQNQSYDIGLSVTGAWSAGIAGGTATASVNLSGSSGFSDLNKSVTNIGRSSGIAIEKPGKFANPNSYAYPFTPYIFGQTKPASVVDSEPLQADITTFGLLRTAFTADPAASTGAGGWWKGVYRDKPDVALNHPSRWTWRKRDPVTPNCLDYDGGDCVYLEPSDPGNLWESNFHVMRGFFISNAQSAGKGPQLTTAKAGDKLELQARVYNYSFYDFKDLPQGSKAHVRFYAQEIDVNNEHRPKGNSILVNEVTLSEIPPFSDADKAELNWVPVSTEFDTTGYDDKYLIFWVVVWIEDEKGTLMPEIEGHGLKEVPGTLASLADVKEEAYSNNVGFYNSAFYVFPAASASQAPIHEGEPASILLTNTGLCEKRVVQGQTVDVTADVMAENNGASGVTAFFYDGDPHEGGTVFGLERIPYIAENGTYQVEAPYEARACGKHELFAVVHEGTPDEVLLRIGKVKVDCGGH